MKRLLGILSLLLSFCCAVTASAYTNDSEFLADIGILPEAVDFISDEPITRGEFAHIAAKINGSGEKEPADTVFSDVKSDNPHSGYIGYLADIGIVSGVSEGNFNPDDNLTSEMAYKILVDCMKIGPMANQLGGFPDGYAEVADYIGITRILPPKKEMISGKDMVSAIAQIIELEYKELTYLGKDAVIDENSAEISVITDIMNLNGYKGTVTGVNASVRSMKVKIERNLYKTNNQYLPENSDYTFKCDGDIDILKYENVPVEIWVDNEDNIIAIGLQKGAEVYYKNIYSVNGDYDTENTYAPQYIKTLSFKDTTKKYTVSENAKIRYNNEYTSNPIALTGNVARVVLKDGKVIAIDSWDLIEGGIITKVSEEEIVYTQASNSKATIEDFAEYETKKVFINGESVDIKQLKPNTYFDYYAANSEYIVIAASEKVITDVLKGAGQNQISIGNNTYDIAKNIYVKSLTSGNYQKNADMSDLFNNTVDVYFNHKDEAVYIGLSKTQTPVLNNFLGVLEGYGTEDYETYQLKIWTLEPEVSVNVYSLANKAQFQDGLTFESVISTAKKTDGSGIYLFELNSKNEIISVAKPIYYPGFEDKASISSTPDSRDIYVAVNNKTAFIKDTEIRAIYMLDGKFMVGEVTSDELRYRQTNSNVSVFLLGEEDSLDVRMSIICGDSLPSLRGRDPLYGVVYGKSYVLNDDDEVECEIEVAGRTGNTYRISESLGENIPSLAFVTYYDGVEFDKSDIVLETSDIVDLTGDCSTWTESGILQQGEIKNINSFAVEFMSGDVYFLHPTFCSVIEIEGSSKKTAKTISADNLKPGDTVYYYATDTVRTIITVE